jgi:7,8-dihydropterin-6-yl-methyl-4-(beta-D-ribofuranosyl)aminobenzene 5'-phosphate synthase
VRRILSAASAIGNVHALVGGLHGFSEFELIENLGLICPAHCTQYARQIQILYPQKFIQPGAGKIIEI